MSLVGAALALTWANLSVVAPLWHELGELLRLDETAMGAVGGVGGLAMLLSMPLWGRLTDRFDARAVLIAGQVMAGVAFAVWGAAIAWLAHAGASPQLNFALTAGLRAVASFAVGGAAVASLPLVAALGRSAPAQAIARFGAMSSVGLVGGPAFVALAPGLASTTRLELLGALTAASGLAAMRLPRPTAHPDHGASAVEPLPWRYLGAMLLGLFVVNLGLALVDFGSSYYAVDVLGLVGADAAWTSGVGLTVAAVASGGAQAVLGGRSGWRVGATVAVSGAALLVGMLLLLAARTAPLAWLGYAVAGVAHGLAMPALQTALLAVVPPRSHGRASSGSSAALGLAYIVGPVLAGLLHGFHALGTVACCALLGGAILAQAPWVSRSVQRGAAAVAAGEGGP
ncbi:MAG: MFS transporter [Sandaracinaceae bacterium]|nr:MFS transporter [Sandaracinaceae bacterium]